ncbi:MAG: hypothetical protein C0403_10055 [Desulfobacterium sp.]|nr:hypothetical protein [Desulfobacterium sp.]
MPFVEIPGLKGKVYVPAEAPEEIRKHRCRDCFSCQWCSDDRCCVCLKEKGCSRRNRQDY